MRAPASLLAALAVLGAGGAAFLMDWRASPPPTPPPAPPNAFAPAPPSSGEFGWRLSGAMWAHRAVVLEVETTRPAEALAIAQQLTAAYQDRFDEVLVYVFESGVHPRRPIERVQWTRTRGYRTLTLRP